jgi:hypothetical protein
MHNAVDDVNRVCAASHWQTSIGKKAFSSSHPVQIAIPHRLSLHLFDVRWAELSDVCKALGCRLMENYSILIKDFHCNHFVWGGL